jgi:hypothetical protein
MLFYFLKRILLLVEMVKMTRIVHKHSLYCNSLLLMMVDPVFKNSLVVVVDTSPPKWTPHKHKPNPGFKASDGSAAVTEVTGTAVP